MRDYMDDRDELCSPWWPRLGFVLFVASATITVLGVMWLLK